MSHCHP